MVVVVCCRSALFVGTSNRQVYALDSLVEEGGLKYEVNGVHETAPTVRLFPVTPKAK